MSAVPARGRRAAPAEEARRWCGAELAVGAELDRPLARRARQRQGTSIEPPLEVDHLAGLPAGVVRRETSRFRYDEADVLPVHPIGPDNPGTCFSALLRNAETPVVEDAHDRAPIFGDIRVCLRGGQVLAVDAVELGRSRRGGASRWLAARGRLASAAPLHRLDSG